jgi:hypothetical protein
VKIREVGAELFHADRGMDGWTHRHDETNSRFLQFCERAKKFLGSVLENAEITTREISNFKCQFIQHPCLLHKQQ